MLLSITRTNLPRLYSQAFKPTKLIFQVTSNRARSFTSTSIMSEASKTLPSEVQSFLKEITERRSNYTLTKKSTLSDSAIKEVIETALTQVPSSFGSYTTRILLVVKEEHDKLWDIITEIIKAVTPPEQFESYTKARLAGFKNSYGTVLFFEDPENTRKLQDKYPFIKDKIPEWGLHSNAMHQYAIWTAFTLAGLGANLQHYNPLIDEKTKAQFDVPTGWQLVAQLVFGKPSSPPNPKPTEMAKPLTERLLIRGADI
jgi:uncharacterized protein